MSDKFIVLDNRYICVEEKTFDTLDAAEERATVCVKHMKSRGPFHVVKIMSTAKLVPDVVEIQRSNK